MSAFASNYELPANGETRTSNSCIAAALSTIGIGGRTQRTQHVTRGQEKTFLSFHFEAGSNVFPGIKTSDLVGRLLTRQIQVDGLWDEPTKLFMAAWLAVTSRATFLKRGKSDLQLIKMASGLCSLEPPRQGNIHDLRRVARDAALPVEWVSSRRLAYALITVGFAPVTFADDGTIMTAESITFPGLTLEMCLNVFREINAYNQSLASGLTVIPPPPSCDLPGAPPGLHPFQFAVQALANYAQIMDMCIPRATTTLFFRNQSNSAKTALIDDTATDEQIGIAARHALQN